MRRIISLKKIVLITITLTMGTLVFGQGTLYPTLDGFIIENSKSNLYKAPGYSAKLLKVKSLSGKDRYSVLFFDISNVINLTSASLNLYFSGVESGSELINNDTIFYLTTKTYDRGTSGEPNWTNLDPKTNRTLVDSFIVKDSDKDSYIKLTSTTLADTINAEVARGSKELCLIICRKFDVNTSEQARFHNSSNTNTPYLEIEGSYKIAPVLKEKSLTGGDITKINDSIKISFSEKMKTATVDAAISVSPSLKNPVYNWTSDSLLTITHDGFEALTEYTIAIASSCEDVNDGLTIGTADTLRFRTGIPASTPSDIINSRWTRSDDPNSSNGDKMKLLNEDDGGTDRIGVFFADLSFINFTVDTAALFLGYKETQDPNASWSVAPIGSDTTFMLYYKPNHPYPVNDSSTWEAINNRGDALVFIDSFHVTDNHTGRYVMLSGSRFLQTIKDNAGDTVCFVITRHDTATAGNGLVSSFYDFNDSKPPVILVTGDNVAPSMTSVAPAGGSADIKLDSVITITFSETMNTDSVEAAISVTPDPGNLAYSWDGKTLTIDHDAFGAGQEYTVEITTKAQDFAGNKIAKDSSFSFTGINEKIPPTITYVAPADGSTDIALDSVVTIVFSEAMDKTKTEGAITVSPDLANKMFTWKNDTVLISGDDMAGSITYTITIGTGATDLAGNALEADSSFSFMSAKETTPPTITKVTPANAATDVAIDASIVIIFSEAMDTDSVEKALTTSPDITGKKLSWNTNKDTLTISGGTMENNTKYTVTISTSAADMSGNALEKEYGFSFTTIKTSAVNNILTDQVIIYPNPASDYVIVKSEGAANIQIFKANGTLVLSEQNASEINVSSLATGYYIVKIDINSQTVVNSLIIE